MVRSLKRGQQCSHWCPRTLNDDHECNAFLMTVSEMMFQVFNFDFSRSPALQGNMASVLIQYTEVALMMVLMNSEGKSYKLNKE